MRAAQVGGPELPTYEGGGVRDWGCDAVDRRRSETYTRVIRVCFGTKISRDKELRRQLAQRSPRREQSGGREKNLEDDAQEGNREGRQEGGCRQAEREGIQDEACAGRKDDGGQERQQRRENLHKGKAAPGAHAHGQGCRFQTADA